MKIINGVKVRQLKVIPDDRGQLAEILRSDWSEFRKFGQVYYTTAKPGVVKGWHYHKIQTDYFFCLKGIAKVGLFDSRPESSTFKEINEFIIGETNPTLIVIPPLVYHGFKAISDQEVIVLNIPTELYNYENPDEFRVPFDSRDIDYAW